jgi:ketol-acid reductoisomerase
MAATIHRDGDLELLDGKVAVIGFGSQGHAHALNLRDSGVEVVVGLRDGSSSRAAAEESGLEVASIPDAVRGAQVVALLVPDHVQKGVWEAEVAPNLEPGAAVLFAHGLNIHFGRIVPAADRDVIMVAPKAPGHRVRELYISGAGTPGLVAVQQDASGRALALALAYGVGIGCGRVGLLETTFAEETESDLFGEQAVLCGGVPALVQAGFDTLVEAGYQPEIAYYECLNELKLIVDLLYQGGYEYMRYSISDVAEYGDLSRGTRVVDDGVRERMRGILEEIRSGAFAKELFGDDEAGRPRFAELRAEGKRRAESIERVGAELRTLAGAEGLHGKASADAAADVGAHGVR